MSGDKKTIIILFTLALLLMTAGAVFMLDSRQHNSERPGSAVLAKQVLEDCVPEKRNSGESAEVCYSKEFEKVAYEHGHEYAFEVLFELQKTDPAANGCHFIGHGIGYGAYRKNPDNWRELVGQISPSCSYGAPMGVIEMYAAELGEGVITKDFVPTICGPEPQGDCNHIVGHILLADSSVKGNIDTALELCSSIENTAERDRCNAGVFMEHITAFNLIEHGYADESYLNWPARVDDLEELCLSYEGEYLRACWKEITHAVIVKHRNNPKEVFSFCNKTDDSTAAQKCIYHSIGIIAGNYNFDIAALEDMCKLPQPEYPNFEDRCYSGLVASALSSVPRVLPDVLEFCSGLEEKFQGACFNRVGNIMKYNYRKSEQEIKDICSAAPSDFREVCEGKTSLEAQDNRDSIFHDPS